MADRRRYTGTQRLQLLWSLSLFLLVGMVFILDRAVGVPASPLILALVLSVVWLLGLGVLGFRERQQWNKMVAQSSFSKQVGPNAADLETLVDGRSVTVSTTVPGLTAQTHTEVTTTVQEVDASFTVQFEHVKDSGTENGLTTGDDSFDEQFVIDGSSQNVNRILSSDVRTALLSIETEGTCTITGEHVTFEIPFTMLSPGELEQLGEMVITIAKQVEAVGRADR
ncbi:hypothetical protein ACFQJ7_09130 [Halovenus rubra]|uniref:Uncharacterized protein n=2 Tax=Halovenus rubra TaxID=869890 RepID=A0ACC7E519_9EURY|nr:hypothetical protein [Halovenus rubra]